jgi:hypothetical protein
VSHDLTHFGVHQMMDVRAHIRGIFDRRAAATLETAAQAIVDYLRSVLRAPDGTPACPLVRIYKTHLYESLPVALQSFVQTIDLDAGNRSDLRCLTLIATSGDEEAWNDRRRSKGHQAIPLSSEHAVESAPMIFQLLRQLGVPVSSVIKPDPELLLKNSDQVFDVFHVPQAVGSPHIPAQDFVLEHGIESVIGFGGMLSSGDLVCAILFSKIPISSETADLFKVIGLNFKLAMLAVARLPLFDE